MQGTECRCKKLVPLTDAEIEKICPKFEDPVRREMWVLGFKAAHGIMSVPGGKGDA